MPLYRLELRLTICLVGGGGGGVISRKVMKKRAKIKFLHVKVGASGRETTPLLNVVD